METKNITESLHGEDNVSLFLHTAIDEYTKERERTTKLDTKASFFMTTIIGLLTVFIKVIPVEKIIHFINSSSQCCIKCFYFCVSLSILIIGVFLLIKAFYNMFKAYSLTKYPRANIFGTDMSTIIPEKKQKIELDFFQQYKQVLSGTIEKNNEKAEMISAGLKFVFIGFIFLFFSTIGILILTEN